MARLNNLGKILVISWQDLAKISVLPRPCHDLPRSGKILQDLAKIFNLGTPRGGGGAYVGYLTINCIPTLGILISILAPSWGNLNQMTFINIVFIAKWWGI
jgi:hypothetical protein